jgi:hypothetical protein
MSALRDVWTLERGMPASQPAGSVTISNRKSGRRSRIVYPASSTEEVCRQFDVAVQLGVTALSLTATL